MLLWFPYLVMKSIGESFVPIFDAKSMFRGLSVHQSINSEKYEYAISLSMLFIELLVHFSHKNSSNVE